MGNKAASAKEVLNAALTKIENRSDAFSTECEKLDKVIEDSLLKYQKYLEAYEAHLLTNLSRYTSEAKKRLSQGESVGNLCLLTNRKHTNTLTEAKAQTHESETRQNTRIRISVHTIHRMSHDLMHLSIFDIGAQSILIPHPNLPTEAQLSVSFVEKHPYLPRVRGTAKPPHTYVAEKANVGGQGRSENQYSHPASFAVHSHKGIVYLSEIDNHRITVLDNQLKHIRFIGARGQGDMQFYNPNGIALNADGSILAVSDYNNNRIVLLNTDTETVISNIQRLNFFPPDKLNHPQDVVFDRFGFLYIADQGNSSIQKFSPSFEHVASFAKLESSPRIEKVASIMINDRDELIAVGINSSEAIVMSLDGQLRRSIRLNTAHSEYVYINNSYNDGFIISDLMLQTVEFYGPDGAYIRTIECPRPVGAAFGVNGDLYVAYNNAHRLGIW
eukprot:TRINITY_DN7806_c0_g1_i1.p1 TRINITY_DN7806_c0_g1~~TRINITY_DN7806_c0_g1_i1.p1  ORF type:complete len:444 (+),score=112.66 TRINITY_DN7806_c0_g1_i1:48-1379(+)